ADARFQPFGETRMHPHHELDVISVMVEGRISHEGSLEHGASMGPREAQVQRAGGEGFEHNEINPDKTWNRMLQLWVLPETPGERASYKKFKTKKGSTTRIYGGKPGLTASFPAKTSIDVALLNVGQTIVLDGSYYGYLSKGEAEIDGHILEDGDLFKSAKVTLKATKESQLIIIKSN
ncbi:MAG: pirin family protein, partial [Alphaproteobacteria bacterium]|nr:pirin family protein [Alphaproteobacteria bacterium]